MAELWQVAHQGISDLHPTGVHLDCPGRSALISRMLRTRESQVLDFCVEQMKRFDAQAWLTVPGAEREFWALIAFFLSGGQRFGHRDELLTVAENLRPNCAGDFAELVRRFDFDCSRFDSMLKDRITHERAVA